MSGYARLGPLTDRLGLYLATYCGMMIATLAAARDPMVRLLDLWETVSYWPHFASTHVVQNPDRLVWFPDPSCMGGAQILIVGVGLAPHPYRKIKLLTNSGTSVPYFRFPSFNLFHLPGGARKMAIDQL